MRTIYISATLTDAGPGNHEQECADFEASITDTFGTVETAAKVKAEADAVFSKYEEWPAEEATAYERFVYDLWEDAQVNATRHALRGWMSIPDSTCFEVTFWETT